MDNHRNNAETQFTDAGLALLLDWSAESDGELLWEEYCTSNCTMPLDLDIQCRKQIQKTIQKNSRHTFMMRFLKTAGHIAASLTVILCLTVSLITSVEALRVPVLNFILKNSPRATAILFQSSTTPGETQLEELCSILKFSVPEGYTLEMERVYRNEFTNPQTVTSVFMAFLDANENLLTIQVSPAEGSWSVDTENAVVTHRTLEGQNAIFIEKSPEFQVLWLNETQNLFYHISASSMEKADFENYVITLAKEIRYSNAGLRE